MLFEEKSNEIDNQNVPDEFIEITSLFRLHDKNVRKMMFKIINSVFDEDEDTDSKAREVIEYAICLKKRRNCSFFIKLLGDALKIKEKDVLFLCAILDFLDAYNEVRIAMPEFENNDYIYGQEACHKKFSKLIVSVAMNSLLSLVFETISCSQIVNINESVRCKLSGLVGKYTGNGGLCNGEMMKLLFKKTRKKCYKDEMVRMQKMENRVLFLLGFECLLVLADKTEKQQFLKGCLNNFCCVFETFKNIDTDGDYESSLEKAKLFAEQAKQNIKKTNYETERIVNFIEYNLYYLKSCLKQAYNQPVIVESDLEHTSI